MSWCLCLWFGLVEFWVGLILIVLSWAGLLLDLGVIGFACLLGCLVWIAIDLCGFIWYLVCVGSFGCLLF